MRTLIDDLLAEQQSLTAVARFSQKRARTQTPAQARYYRDLIPLTRPAAGAQYAFAVDLDACTGCKACVNACHSLNGLDQDEIWRTAGVLVGGTIERPYQQTVTTACHHCAEPACLLGCPVAAYEKDAATGIVRHLDDQCIGCQYCILKCPYDVPKYSHARGIVRKCDMCYARLAANEAPACVQACPSGAITIDIVSASEIQAETQPGTELVPGAFDPSYTRPTTRYLTRKPIPANAAPGDYAQLRLDSPHWPLIWMLVLVQLAAGLFVCLACACALPAQRFASIAPPVALSGFVTLHAGLVASIFHLGQPRKAWRVFLGLRSSWMSREILVFALFAAASAAAALTSLFYLAPTHAFVSRARAIPIDEIASATPLLTIVAAIIGVSGIFCSAMIYVDTRRAAWNGLITFPKFFGTTLLLGAGGFAAVCGWIAVFNGSAVPTFARDASIFAALFNVLYAAWDALVLLRALRDSERPLHRVAQIVWKFLRRHVAIRVGLLCSATIAGVIAIFSNNNVTGAAAATVCASSIFIGAIIERYCYFTAADAPRMPGRIAS